MVNKVEENDVWMEPEDEFVYQDSLVEHIKAEEVTIFTSVFSPCGSYLVCGSGYGTIGIWQITPFLEEDFWQEGSPSLEPHLKLHAMAQPNIMGEGVSVGAVYSLCFAGSESDLLLVAGHDLGAHCWRWNDLLQALQQSSQQDMSDEEEELPAPCLMLNCPQTVGYLGSRSPLCEVNGLAANLGSPQMYAAAGDGKAYSWDLSTGDVVATFEGHEDYLHCVGVTPDSTALVTGSEDGRVGIWDCRASGTVDFIKVKDSGLSKSKKLPGWVAALDIDEGGNWAVCGGGREKGSFLQTEGFIGAIHLASRTAVNNGRTVVANVQSVCCLENDILVAGSCRSLGIYDRFCTKRRSKVPINFSSAFSVTKCTQSGIFAVSGSSPSVDIFIQKSSRAFSLQFT
mmetsp:Transcript_16073/g.21244  ORF Transcript_16073/g.21244 Transcript_16073/m.21244 type:complete len:398 (+) Transcript_16073:43-1236(+)